MLSVKTKKVWLSIIIFLMVGGCTIAFSGSLVEPYFTYFGVYLGGGPYHLREPHIKITALLTYFINKKSFLTYQSDALADWYFVFSGGFLYLAGMVSFVLAGYRTEFLNKYCLHGCQSQVRAGDKYCTACGSDVRAPILRSFFISGVISSILIGIATFCLLMTTYGAKDYEYAVSFCGGGVDWRMYVLAHCLIVAMAAFAATVGLPFLVSVRNKG